MGAVRVAIVATLAFVASATNDASETAALLDLYNNDNGAGWVGVVSHCRVGRKPSSSAADNPQNAHRRLRFSRGCHHLVFVH